LAAEKKYPASTIDFKKERGSTKGRKGRVIGGLIQGEDRP